MLVVFEKVGLRYFERDIHACATKYLVPPFDYRDGPAAVLVPSLEINHCCLTSLVSLTRLVPLPAYVCPVQD